MSAKKWLIEHEEYVEEDFESLNNEPMLHLVKLMESYARSCVPEKRAISHRQWNTDKDDGYNDAIDDMTENIEQP